MRVVAMLGPEGEAGEDFLTVQVRITTSGDIPVEISNLEFRNFTLQL